MTVFQLVFNSIVNVEVFVDKDNAMKFTKKKQKKILCLKLKRMIFDDFWCLISY